MGEQVDSLEGIFRQGDLYDDVYRGRGKDYQAEADVVLDLIRERNPAAASLLDVGCGTGSHLARFRAAVDHVEGIDLAADMVRVARAKMPDVPLHVGDMRDFDLGRRFDAIACLFSVIAYLPGAADIEVAIERLARHLEPGGVVVVEPWYFPETAVDRHVVSDVAQVDGRTIARVSRGERVGDAHHIEAHYVVAHPEEGIRHFADVHVLAVVARERYEKAFAAAGISVELVKSPRPGLYGPGLFVGVRQEQ